MNVLIVGAGPAGTAMAAHLGNLGVPDVTLVDSQDFPRDKTCGSGVSPKGIEVLRELGVWEKIEPESYFIKGLRLVTPGNRESYQSAGDSLDAVVCNRRILDHELLKHAQERGVRFLPNTHATRLLHQGEGRQRRVAGIETRDGRELRARITVLAGGAHCHLAGRRDEGRQLIHAIMGWWEDIEFRPGYLEMIYDRELVPYYGWLFPESDVRVNIGITYENDGPKGKRNARALFTDFLERQYGKRLAGAKQIGAWKGHPIAYSYKVRDLWSPGLMIIGEAGCLTHPATAEGIYQGMRSGMFGAEALRDVFEERETEEDALTAYEKRVRKQFELSFLAGRLFREAVKTPALDWLVALSEMPVVQSTAAKILAQV